MSTNAFLGYVTDKKQIKIKCVNYGAFNENKRFLKIATSKEIIDSVDKGDSSMLLAGFYNDFEHCKLLNWSKEMFDEHLQNAQPVIYDSIERLVQAHPNDSNDIDCYHNIAPYLYLLNGKHIIVYEFDDKTLSYVEQQKINVCTQNKHAAFKQQFHQKLLDEHQHMCIAEFIDEECNLLHAFSLHKNDDINSMHSMFLFYYDRVTRFDQTNETPIK